MGKASGNSWTGPHSCQSIRIESVGDVHPAVSDPLEFEMEDAVVEYSLFDDYRGHSPGVKFPRVLGIEAVGEVEDAPGGEFKKGDVVGTCMVCTIFHLSTATIIFEFFYIPSFH